VQKAGKGGNKNIPHTSCGIFGSFIA